LVDQVAEYCARAALEGVTELALTEHSHRFVEFRSAIGDFWLRTGHEPTSVAMGEYFDFHARSSLDRYVELALAAKSAGLPVKVGLEVDFCRGQMDVVDELLAQYPFDVLIGSVHWLGTWQFDDYENPAHRAEWDRRDVDTAWRAYTQCLGELASSGAVDVLAHSDLIKVAGFVPAAPTEFWDAMAEAMLAVDISVECSSAGWVKPIGEQYPSASLLDRLVKGGATFTTASDAHRVNRVGERAHDLAALLRVRGVTELASYDHRRRVMVPLGDQ
jgi:histidinol-phosphatase (PHP family)